MHRVILLLLCAHGAWSIVCTPQLCQMMSENAQPLNCTGGVVKGGGFCGCTDACAKVVGETCQAGPVGFGFIPAGQCDEGLTCSPKEHMRLNLGVCEENPASKRFLDPGNNMTKCETIRAQMMIILVIWDGMWTPKCDGNGRYLPEQCDRNNKCFCVTPDEGLIVTERVPHHHPSCETILQHDPKPFPGESQMQG